MPTYTKLVSKHDRIEIDGTDYSNSFRVFGMTSSDTLVDVSGFSVTGVDENLPGPRAQSFQGEFFFSDGFVQVLWPLHSNRTVVEMLWQPNGLVDATAQTFYANVTINEFSPSNTRGDPSTSPFTATVADETGITMATGT